MNNLLQNKLNELQSWRAKLCLERDKNYSFGISIDISELDSEVSFCYIIQLETSSLHAQQEWECRVDALLAKLAIYYPYLS